MMRRILFINTYYDKFLSSQLLSQPSTYQEAFKLRIDSRFGDSDFYSYWLNQSGWSAVDVIANDYVLQMKWASENNIQSTNMLEICMMQIIAFRPSIVYFQDLSMLTDEVANFLRANNIKICGQHASPLPPTLNFRNMDLFITSMPHLLDLARSNGTNSIYLPLAFDHRILSETSAQKWDARSPGGFVGGYTPSHKDGVEFVLSALKHQRSMALYGYGWDDSLEALLNGIAWNGAVWGLDMFNLLGGWKISLNRHIDMSGSHANNMRMYEATGMGALLLTDRKQKNDLFVSDSEIIEYDGFADLHAKLSFLLSNPSKAEEIALRGQKKTLEKHTYQLRMHELSSVLEKL
jgi:hypothetical protein